MKAFSVKQTKNSITVDWVRHAGADGYILFGSQCNTYKHIRKLKQIAVFPSENRLTYTQKNLKNDTYYKYVVKAYKIVNGKKKVIAVSTNIHVTTTSKRYGIEKAVAIKSIGNKKNTLTYTMHKGEKAQIKAESVFRNDKPSLFHRGISYESSNKKVAKVTSKGVIKAVGKGTCKIWVYAQNGVYKELKIAVK